MATIEIYVSATAEFCLEAIQRSVEQFVTGKVERENRAFAPSTDEFSRNVRRWQEAIDFRDDRGPPLHNGLLEMDWGQGMINMRGLTEAEQDKIIANKGCGPDGKSLAYMPTEAIRVALSVDAIEGAPRKVVPSLKGMG